MNTTTPLIDFLSLFLPAIIGIFGSYYLYSAKQSQRETNLRSAFIAELEGVEYLERWPIEDRTVPAINPISVSVYEGNNGDLALLDEPEVSAVVRYYTRAKTVRDALQFHTDVISRTQATSLGTDVKASDREDMIRALMDKLELARQRALLVLKSDSIKTELPVEGSELTEYPSLQDIKPLLLDYSFIEEQKGDYMFTKAGEEFYAGELVLTGHPKTNDTLGRDKSHFRLTWEQRYALLKYWLSSIQ